MQGGEEPLAVALQQRNVIHVRVLDLDSLLSSTAAAAALQRPSGPSTAAIPAQPPPPVPTRRA